MGRLTLRPMGVGDIIDTSCRIYRWRLLTFVVIVMAGYLPYALIIAGVHALILPYVKAMEQQSPVVQVILAEDRPASLSGYDAVNPPDAQQGSLVPGQVVQFRLIREAVGIVIDHHRDITFQQTRSSNQAETMIAMQFLGAMLLFFAVQMIFVLLFEPIIRAALICEISASYLSQPQSAMQTFRTVQPRLFAMIITNFLVYMISMLGYVMCCFPGIAAQLIFMLVGPVVVLEGMFGGHAMKRSYELLTWNFGKAFLVGGATLVLIAMLGNIVLPLTYQLMITNESIVTFLARSTGALLLPVGVGAVTLFYYDLRIRKEAFDIQMQVAA